MLPKKGQLLIFILVFILTVSPFSTMAYENEQEPPQLMVDGRSLYPDVPPTIESGRILVEMRSIFEAFGAELEWNESDRTVSVYHDNMEMLLTIDGSIALIQGQPYELEVPPRIVNDRTVVPARFVSETLGAKVTWHEDTRTAMITTSETALEDVEEIESQELPPEVDDWIGYSQNTWLAQEKTINDITYILVTYGEKPTGGYTVDIQQVQESSDEIIVTAAFSEPEEGSPVTTALTYPYDLFAMNATDKPVVYEALGTESYIPTLMNIDELPPIAAESDGIKIFSPAPDSAVEESFSFEGIANVFEGNVLYRLLDSNETELDSGFTTGAMGDWGHIEETIVIPDDIEDGESMLLEFYTESAKDGSVQDLIQIPLVYEALE